MHRTGAHVQMENPPWSKVLRHARLPFDSKGEARVETIEEGSRRKGRLDSPGGDKAVRR